MDLFEKICRRIQRFTNTGVNGTLHFSERIRIQLVNIAAIATFSFVFVFLSIYIASGHTKWYELLIGLGWITVSLIPLLLNHFRQYTAAKLVMLFVPTIFISFLYSRFGLTLRPEPVYLLVILNCCYFFDRIRGVALSLGVLCLYFVVVYQMQFNPPPMADVLIQSIPFYYFVYAALFTILMTQAQLRETRQFNMMTVEQNKILAQKNVALERFSHIVSHDLKTPLRTISSFSDLIEMELVDGDKDKVNQYLGFIKKGSAEMSNLLKDIRTVSSLHQTDATQNTQLDLNGLIENVRGLQSMNHDFPRGQILAKPLPKYPADERSFQLLFEHLINNSLKFNESEAPIVEVWSEEKGGRLLIYFKDNGIGIESRFHEQIFDYFKRLHNKEDYAGTGVGLGLCRQIVLNHGGHLQVQSIPSEGSTFIVDLPL